MANILLFILIISLLIQIYYFLFIFLRLAFYTQKAFSKNIKSVSVIIAAHNEQKNLQKLIPILLRQNHPDFEIIIADDRSTDHSYQLISSFGDPRIKIIHITNTPEGYNSKKYALSQAIQNAEKEVILLTDADCYPMTVNWITIMQQSLSQDKEIVLGYSPYEKTQGFLNLFIRYETFYTAIQYLSFALIHKAYMGVGRNLAYYKHVFTQNKGFNKYQNVTGGDDDLFIGQTATSKNVVIQINPKAHVLSIPKYTYKEFFTQKIRHLSVGKKYKLSNKIKTGLLPFSQALFYFSTIALLLSECHIYAILSIFILRTLLLIIIFTLISRKLGETIKWLWFPVLDLSYLLNYTITGVSAVFSKNIKWT